jgi:hypothetical protein
MEVTTPDGRVARIPLGWQFSAKDAEKEAEDVIRYNEVLHGSAYKIVAE